MHLKIWYQERTCCAVVHINSFFLFSVACVRHMRVLFLSERFKKIIAAGKFKYKVLELAVDIAALGPPPTPLGTVPAPTRQWRLFPAFFDLFC